MSSHDEMPRWQIPDEDGPEVTDRPRARRIDRSMGTVKFDHVSFSYECEHTVLDDISFAVSAGTRVGVMGPAGAGKTTLISLLMRFYDPSAGAILLDGVDLR